MKNRTLVIVGLVTVSLLLLASTFVAGVRVGATESAFLQSSVKATMLVSELRTLRAGKADLLVKAKELELDSEVFMYSQLIESGHPWLFWAENNDFEHERYLRQVARYRKEFPAVIPTLQMEGTDETRIRMRAQAETIARATEKIIREYGQ